MKVVPKTLMVALLVAAMGGSALADGPRGRYPHGPQRSYQSHSNGGGWIAPLLFLGLAGAVIGAAASQPSAPPPVYVQPPVTYVPPAVTYVQPAPIYMAPAPVASAAPPQPVNAWYFCKSVGQYYPYTQYCPEGWQLVSPTPQ